MKNAIPAADLAAPQVAAKEAGLRYVSDESPGITRLPKGRSFQYRDVDGKRVRAAAVLGRIRLLAIPPAWTDVWICPAAHGHIQATGRDLRGRKQYCYHSDWSAIRDSTKFERMIAFGEALPGIRRQVARDLRARHLSQTKIIAALIRLLETTHIRIGNPEYARQNHSFGLTTLRDRHVRIRGATIRFLFPGKSGKTHEIELHDPRLAKIIRQSQDLPGQVLFQYLDETGDRRKVNSEDVNAYLREIAGEQFSAKDFRTWAGTVLAAIALREFMTKPHAQPTKKYLQTAVAAVAAKLGNTPSICRKCYIHPAVMEGYLAGETIKVRMRSGKDAPPRAAWHLTQEELAVLRFLRHRKQPHGR